MQLHQNTRHIVQSTVPKKLLDAFIVTRSKSIECSDSIEQCADELVVGGGVGWSYDRRRRRATHFSSAAAAWLYGRRRRRQTGRVSSETAHSLDRRFFSGFTEVSHFTCDLC